MSGGCVATKCDRDFFAAWDKDYSVAKELSESAWRPGVSDRPNSKTEGTQQQATWKRLTPAPHDKRSGCIQGQAQCLDHTSKEGEADTPVSNQEKMSQATADKDALHPE